MTTKKLIVCVLLLFLTSCASTTSVPVQTEHGNISGLLAGEDPVVTIYKGIPYAAPPVDQLRWKPPQAVKAWKGVRKMEKFGNTCLQTKGWASNKGMKEDCLYLNVWTPAKSQDERLPVMFWIHGGGFTQGSGNLNGIPLAERGVVLVSINYRLGPLGFFAHPLLSKESEKGVSGNYGILDMVQALKWVQTNIGQFGGDEDNVTIFGESAGGAAVYILCSSDLTKGLFHKAIAESPWVTDESIAPLTRPAYDKEAVETTGKRIAKKLLGDSEVTLAKLRSIDSKELVKKTEKGFRLPAAVEGYVLKDNPANLFEKGLQQINDAWFAQPTRWMMRGMSKKNKDTYLYHFAMPGSLNRPGGWCEVCPKRIKTPTFTTLRTRA